MVSFGAGRVPPPSADTTRWSASNLNGRNAAAYDYGGTRALQCEKQGVSESDKNGSQRATANLYSPSNVWSGSESHTAQVTGNVSQNSNSHYIKNSDNTG